MFDKINITWICTIINSYLSLKTLKIQLSLDVHKGLVPVPSSIPKSVHTQIPQSALQNPHVRNVGPPYTWVLYPQVICIEVDFWSSNFCYSRINCTWSEETIRFYFPCFLKLLAILREKTGVRRFFVVVVWKKKKYVIECIYLKKMRRPKSKFDSIKQVLVFACRNSQSEHCWHFEPDNPLFWEGCPVHSRMFSGISGLFPLVDS